MEKQGYVHIMASKRNGTLYIGVTSDLPSELKSVVKVWSLASPGNMDANRWYGLQRSTQSKLPAPESCR